MSIPVSSVVDVAITIGAAYPARAGFGTLNIVTKEAGISLAERIRYYSSIDGVAGDFATTTEAYKAANAYFSQQPKPTSLAISTRFETAQAAQLRGGGGAETTIATWNAITTGSFAISIDGVAEDITGLDFSLDLDNDDIADAIETALQAVAAGGYTAATCTWDGTRFTISSGTTGATSTISFLTDAATGTDIADLLDMRQGQATKGNGIDAETITASLTAIQAASEEWYGFMFTKEVREDVAINGEDAIEAAADWAEARIKVFFNTTNDLDTIDSVSTTDIAYILEAAAYRRTMTTFCTDLDSYPSASIAGRAFTVNFNQPDSTITLKFKQLPGITAEDLNTNQKTVLDAKRANALIVVGSSDMYAESFMAASGVFFDEVHGLDWLQNAIQTNVFGYLLSRPTKVPYTDKGVAGVEQQVISALDEGVRNGLLAPGETIDGRFLPLGYETVALPVADINQSDQDARNYPGLSFTAIGAGAIHSVQINGIFER